MRFAKRFAKTELQNRIDKKKISKHFLKGIWKGKSLAPKLRISADESLSQPWCSHSNGQPFQHLQNTIEICISCETSFKNWKWKMWKRSFRARHPSKSKSGRCENEAFMRDVPPKVEVEDVKQSFRVRSPSKSESGRCENEGFRARHPSKRRSFGARRPSKSESGRCENKAFVRDLPQKVEVEDVKTKLWCETSLKKWLWKICKQSSRARRPYKSDSGKMWNRSFRAETSLKKWKWKMWKRSFRARRPSKVKVEDVKTKLSCETWAVMLR